METQRYNIQDVGEKVDKILALLTGNEFDEQDSGLIGNVRKLKSDLEELKQWKEVRDKTYIWVMGAAAGLGSFITWIISTVIDKLK